MILKRILSISVFLIFFSLATNLAFAQPTGKSCGDRNTSDQCGGSGGCAVGSRCEITRGWLGFNVAEAECVPDPEACSTTEPDQSNTLTCGTKTDNRFAQCGCAETDNQLQSFDNPTVYGYCCGYALSKPGGVTECYADAESYQANGGTFDAPPRPVDDEPDEPSDPDPADDSSSTLSCGETTYSPFYQCSCAGAGDELKSFDPPSTYGYCCGWASQTTGGTTRCYASQAEYDRAVGGGAEPGGEEPPADQGSNNGAGGGNNPGTGNGSDQDDNQPDIDIFKGPNSENFNTLNPLRNSDVDLDSPGDIVSRILLFAFPLAGLILFAMIVWGGFEMLTNAANSKGMEAGRQRVTAAIVGFMLLFVSYWVFQIVEVIFGIVIL